MSSSFTSNLILTFGKIIEKSISQVKDEKKLMKNPQFRDSFFNLSEKCDELEAYSEQYKYFKMPFLLSNNINKLLETMLPPEIKDPKIRKYVPLFYNLLVEQDSLELLDKNPQEIEKHEIITTFLPEEVRKSITTILPYLRSLRLKNLNQLISYVYENKFKELSKDIERMELKILEFLTKYKVLETYSPGKYQNGDYSFLPKRLQESSKQIYESIIVKNPGFLDEEFAQKLKRSPTDLQYWDKFVEISIHDMKKEINWSN